MAYKRILTIQDISCVGQCSMTVALPILSACGHETCILPTAILSTHTGGFGKPVVVRLGEDGKDFWKHWLENGITFDAILVGYLGNISAVETVSEIIDALLAPEGLCIVDPALADHGKRYSGLDEEYAQAVKLLCHKADIILPNVTEAAMFSDIPYRPILEEEYVDQLLESLGHPCVVLTGVGYEKGKTGIVLWDRGEKMYYSHEKVEQNFHGTGDMFASCFTGALMQGKSKLEAVKIAADFVKISIENTVLSPAHWYGVKFETALPYLIHSLQE